MLELDYDPEIPPAGMLDNPNLAPNYSFGTRIKQRMSGWNAITPYYSVRRVMRQTGRDVAQAQGLNYARIDLGGAIGRILVMAIREKSIHN